MPYVTEENGKLNNFAREIEPVVMEPRTPSQKRLLIMTALMGAVLVAGSLWIATLVS
ncbi:MAG: ssl1498 family light-harvesting-like protein [Thermostichales cyanobacterium SZTDM-1c_bins_54]